MNKLLYLLFAVTMVAFLSCDATKNATSAVKETTKKAGSAVGNATKKAGGAVKGAAEKTGSAVKGAAGKTSDAVKSTMNKEEGTKEAKDMKEAAVEPVKEASSATTTATTATPGTISFAAANERYSANGTFKRWDFTKVEMNRKDITSLNAAINIDLTSIWEKSPKLTDHLKADDYFGVAKYTTATIDIINVKDMGDGNYAAEMSLSMRGKSQKMKSEFTVTNQNPLTVKGTAKVDRSIFGIGVENTSVPSEIEVTYETVIPKM